MEIEALALVDLVIGEKKKKRACLNLCFQWNREEKIHWVELQNGMDSIHSSQPETGTLEHVCLPGGEKKAALLKD